MNEGCCGNQVDVAALAAAQKRVLTYVLVINLATFAMMVAGSALSGSSSLLSGTLDNLGDAITYAVSLAVVSAAPAVKARVAFFKGLLILGAAAAVAVHILWRSSNFDAPILETMGLAALLNLGANALCLRLLHPYRHDDLNMASVWECSRNDVFEGLAVIGAAVGVWLFASAWPDIFVAVVLLALFLRSATRVLRNSWRELHSASASN